MDALKTVREAVYGHIVRMGWAPGVDEVARAVGLTMEEARAALRALAEAHVIVLDEDGAIHFAAPFAGRETRFRVRSVEGLWFAPCAWDAFGIPAALHADAEIETRFARSGEVLRCGVRD